MKIKNIIEVLFQNIYQHIYLRLDTDWGEHTTASYDKPFFGILKTNEHITPRSGDRCEKNGQELNRTRKEGGGQCRLINAGRWPVLH